ncbi:hypothetical protein SRABI83_02066 [Arthrobacter sp. Bi83]|jgi:hypothetical protein|uniref:hypothetical protein n=1 Tax=Arthrobacter sp. Bi83 TaxID=2822353 RepID=UPI001DAF44DE|nr:hypothetical protein [Arthrobacter sp. Bi83]CAH0207824.1 hypothetical protein SRABI83_02066 [Arthrobacter sp. Bi83]
MNTTTAQPVEVKVDSARHVEERLNSVVRDLQMVASRTHDKGILVTWLSPGHYTVSLSDDVPYGLTRELVH